MYPILLFIHYGIVANSRKRYTVKDVLQMLEDDFHKENVIIIFTYIVILDVNMANDD